MAVKKKAAKKAARKPAKPKCKYCGEPIEGKPLVQAVTGNTFCPKPAECWVNYRDGR